MSKTIDKYISEKDIEKALQQCIEEKQYEFGKLLGKIWMDNYDVNFKKEYKEYIFKLINKLNEILNKVDLVQNDGIIRVMCSCSWASSKELCEFLNKMSKGDYTWNDIRIVYEEPADYYVVINAPLNTESELTSNTNKTILFRMEPYMEHNKGWKKWSSPSKESFLFAGFHEDHYNNIEWHLSLSYSQLMSLEIIKDDQLKFVMSSIVSNKMSDIGHKKRISFLQYIESKNEFPLHIFGTTENKWNEYKGRLPDREKDNGLLPYKYTFNAENNEIPNYFTEKLIDGILSECLTVYFGCPNVSEYIDTDAYVQIKLDDFEHDYNIIKRMIEEDWWSKRLPVIRKEKQKILNDLQFFPRIEKILKKIFI